MSEPIEWVYQAGTGCAYCKDGLCQRMNQLMEDGMSQRKAAEIMAVESGGKWTANNIRQMFKNLMGKTLPTPAKPKKKLDNNPEPKGGEEYEKTYSTDFGWMNATEDFRKAFEAFIHQVQVARHESWQKTSKETAQECAKRINDLTHY